MKVKVISAFCIGGGKDVFEGEILELSDKDAKVKVLQGFVVPISEDELAALEKGEEKKGKAGK